MDKRSNVMAKNVVWLMFISILFKIIGFINRAIVVGYYGATFKTDAFFAVTGFVEGFAAIVLAGVTVGIVNIYISEKQKSNNPDKIITNYLFIFVILLTFVALLIMIGADIISVYLLPTEGIDYGMVAYYLRLSSTILPFQGIITVYGAVLQAEERFTPVKSTGLISSLISIISIILLNSILKEESLLFSFIVGYIINAVLIFFFGKKYIHLKNINSFNWKMIKELFMITGPLILGSAALEVNLFVDKAVAASIGEGVVTSLACAKVLYLAVEGVFIQNVVMVIFPKFTKLVNSENHNELENQISISSVLLTGILLPITIIVLMYSEDIVSIAYGRGTFNEYAINLTSMGLVGYIIGIIPLAYRDVLLKVCYANKNTKIPMVCSIISMILNIVLDLLFVKYIGIMGVALATSIAHIVSFIILYYYIKIKIKINVGIKHFGEYFKVIICNVICVVICLMADLVINNNFILITIYLLICSVLIYFSDLVGIKANIHNYFKRIKRN